MAPIITALSALSAASIALAALLVARGQLRLNRENQRETTAKTTFREFLKLCVEHPDLAYGKSTELNRDQYEWFVTHFLWAAEEILEYAPKDWEANLRLHMVYHRDYLENDKRFRNEDLPTYSLKLQSFINKAILTSEP